VKILDNDQVTTTLVEEAGTLWDAGQVAANGTWLGQMNSEVEALKSNLDTFFLIVNGSLIILMQAGFGFLEAGSVRSKNVTNILIKNFADLCFGAGSFICCGYAFAFGEGSPYIGFKYFVTIDLPNDQYAFFFFQCTFAATCATIVSGAIAERCNFNGYILFSIILTGVVYPIQTHWAWSGDGWLSGTEFHDFAGSGVVHLAGGVVAFVGAVMLGPRIGRFRQGVKAEDNPAISGHSIPLISLGAFILIFGFFAFNGGSQASISAPGDGGVVAKAVLNTLVACCTAGTVVLFVNKALPGGKWSIVKLINGCLAGMVSICAGCDGYYPWAAALVAAVAGAIYVVMSKLVASIKVDDPLDAVAVHAGAGLWGILAAPIFMETGILYTGSESAMLMLVWNAIAAGAFIVWNTVCAILMFGFLKMLRLFRVDEAHEIEGLDTVKHNEPAYPIDSYIEEDERPKSVITASLYGEMTRGMMNQPGAQWANRAQHGQMPPVSFLKVEN